MNTPLSDQPESLAAILAEMRRANFQPQFYQRCVNEYADRIEAAAERERVKVRRDAEIEWTRIGYEERKAEERPGNAAAMRAALEKFLDFSRRGLAFVTSYRYTEAENAEIEAAFDGAKSALAAPARNCDRFATERKAWEFYFSHTPDNGNIIDGFPPWLYATEPVYGDAAESEGCAK